MNIERIPGIELFVTIFASVHKTVGEMPGLNVIDNIRARLMLKRIANSTVMTSTFIFGYKVFKLLVTLGCQKAYKKNTRFKVVYFL